MAKKEMTDLEKADAFLKGIETYTKELEGIKSELENLKSKKDYIEEPDEEAEAYADAADALKGLGRLSGVQRKIVKTSGVTKKVSDLEKDKSEKERQIARLSKGIGSAISKYIADAENERGTLEANIARYEDEILKKREEYKVLEEEIKKLEDEANGANEKAKEAINNIINLKERVLVDLSVSIESCENFKNSTIAECKDLRDELNKNKKKYKDYIALSEEELPEPEEKKPEEKKPEEKKPEEKKPEEKKPEEKKPEEKKPEEKKPETKTARNNGETKFVYVPVSDDVSASSEEPKTNSDSNVKEGNTETDEQAFKRIYGLIKKKEALSAEDTDKMYEILSDEANFKKYKINTDHILPFTKSKAQRIYTSLGNQLDGQIKASLSDKELLEGLNSKDLTRWKDINELGCDNPCNNIVESLEKAIEKETDEGKKKELETLKGRYEKFVSSAQTMTSVRRNRNELHYEAISESTSEVKTKGMAEELAGGVKTTDDVAREDAAKDTIVKSSETPKRDVSDKDLPDMPGM